VDFLGSDDFTPADKEEAARAINDALLAECALRTQGNATSTGRVERSPEPLSIRLRLPSSPKDD
jgi:hypothetical protein